MISCHQFSSRLVINHKNSSRDGVFTAKSPLFLKLSSSHKLHQSLAVQIAMRSLSHLSQDIMICVISISLNYDSLMIFITHMTN